MDNINKLQDSNSVNNQIANSQISSKVVNTTSNVRVQYDNNRQNITNTASNSANVTNISNNNSNNKNSNTQGFAKIIDNQEPPPDLDRNVPKKQELFGIDALLAKAAIDPQGFYHIDDHTKMDLNSSDLTVIQTQKDGTVKKMPLSEFLKVPMPDLPKPGESVVEYMRRVKDDKVSNIKVNGDELEKIKDNIYDGGTNKNFNNVAPKNNIQAKQQENNGSQAIHNVIVRSGEGLNEEGSRKEGIKKPDKHKSKKKFKHKTLFSDYIFDPFVMKVLGRKPPIDDKIEKSSDKHVTTETKDAKINNMEGKNINNLEVRDINDANNVNSETVNQVNNVNAVDQSKGFDRKNVNLNNLQEEVGEYSMQFGLEHKDLIGDTAQNTGMRASNNQVNNSNKQFINNQVSNQLSTPANNFNNNDFNAQNVNNSSTFINSNIGLAEPSSVDKSVGENTIVTNNSAINNTMGLNSQSMNVSNSTSNNATSSTQTGVNIDLQQLHKRLEKKNFAVNYDLEYEKQAEENDAPHLSGPTEILNPSLAKYKILIIEDNSDVRYQYEFILKREGFTVITAKNGEEGIVTAIKERPQLILLDILMPEVDGWEVLKALREYTATYKPKIMITSNLGSPEDIEKAYKLGADLFVIKADTTLKELVNKVKKMLLHNSQQSVYMLPLNIKLPEVKNMLASVYPELQSGVCPECGGPLGLKLIPTHKQDTNTNKTILEFTARLVCLRCGKEWI